MKNISWLWIKLQQRVSIKLELGNQILTEHPAGAEVARLLSTENNLHIMKQKVEQRRPRTFEQQ